MTTVTKLEKNITRYEQAIKESIDLILEWQSIVYELNEKISKEKENLDLNKEGLRELQTALTTILSLE